LEERELSNILAFWQVLLIALALTVYVAGMCNAVIKWALPKDFDSTLDLISAPNVTSTLVFHMGIFVVLLYFVYLAYSHFSGHIFIGFSRAKPVFINPKPGHIVIYGRTGSGKSNTAKVIISEMRKKVPILVLDWHGEYASLKGFSLLVPGDNFSINPLDYRFGQLSEHIDFLVDLFGDVYHFSEPQRYMFRSVLKHLYADTSSPTLSQFMEVLEEMPIRSYYDHEIKMALKRRLSGLIEGRAGKALSRKSTIELDELFSSNIVIDLSTFRSLYTKRLFCMILLKLLYDYATTKRGISPYVRHVTVIEEAWNVIPYRRLDSEPSIGERLFAELRKHGELLIAVTQFPSETAWSIMKNARLIVLHSLPIKEFNVIGVDVGSSEPALKVGEAMLVEGSKVTKVNVRRVHEEEFSPQCMYEEVMEVREPSVTAKRCETVIPNEHKKNERYIRIILQRH